MKCNKCKYSSNGYCEYFKQHIKVKKRCWAFEDKLEKAIKDSFKFLNKGGE